MRDQEDAMALLTRDVRQATQDRFEAALVNPVKLIFFTQEPKRLVLIGSLQGQECFFCKETRQLLEEVTALSAKIELQVLDFKADAETAAKFGIDKIPGLVVMDGEDRGIRFYGIPSGYEYSALVEAIVDVSRGDSGLSEKTRQALATIDRPVQIEVFITPTCPHCSTAVRLAHQFALETSYIRGEMVESTEFPKLSDRYNVYGVPKTIINGKTGFEGAVSEEEFLENVLKAIQPPAETS
jgi:glutaredoxin-like protein